MAQPVPGSPADSNKTVCPPGPVTPDGSEKTLCDECLGIFHFINVGDQHFLFHLEFKNCTVHYLYHQAQADRSSFANRACGSVDC